MPTGAYTGVRVRIVGPDNTKDIINAAAGVYTINRRDLKKIELTVKSITAGSESATEQTLQEVNIALNSNSNSNTNVTYTGAVEGNDETKQ